MSRYQLIGPSSTLNFENDWDDPNDSWLAPGDTIASRQWSITPLNVGTPVTPVITGDTSDIAFVSGCERGKVYHAVELVTTTAGLIDARTIVLRCEKS